MTILFVFGKWAKPAINTKKYFRVCLGWFAFVVLPYDYEIQQGKVMKIMDLQEELLDIANDEIKRLQEVLE